MKECRCCKTNKAYEAFYVDRSKKDGRTSYCKVCDSVRSKGWKAKNYEYYRESERVAREADLERNLERVRDWKTLHPENIKASTAKRRSKKGGITAKEIRKLLELQSKKCAGCGADLSSGYHLDHRMPLKLGGSNDRSNIQLLCKACNLSKGALLPEVFSRRLFLRSGRSGTIPLI